MAITDQMIADEIFNEGPAEPGAESPVQKILSKVKAFFKRKTIKVADAEHKPSQFQMDSKKQFLITLGILVVLLLVSGIFFYKTMTYVKDINSKSYQLHSLEHYDLSNLQNMDISVNPQEGDIQSLIDSNKEYDQQIENYSLYTSKLQIPYDNLLKNIYLPPLNIRKDPYTEGLDTTIVGQKFIDKNPYEDIRLIQRGTEFVRNVGENEYNQVENIKIGTIQELSSGLFKIEMSIDFISNSKRSFLLLINKLSMTSDLQNISLINEFIYNLWQEIKESKADMIEVLKSSNTYEGWDEDKIIGYHLYTWLNSDKENMLIDEDIIDTVIRKITVCDEGANETICYYNFREKFSSLPMLAYTIGLESNPNKVGALKDLLSDLPMVLNVIDFTFDKNNEQKFISNQRIQYKGSIKLELFGRGISEAELNEISTKLGETCLQQNINPDSALQRLSGVMLSIDNLGEIDTDRNSYLWELKSILEDIQKEYGKLSNYKKTIKLFEIYRMLEESGICISAS